MIMVCTIVISKSGCSDSALVALYNSGLKVGLNPKLNGELTLPLKSAHFCMWTYKFGYTEIPCQ